WLGSQPGSGRHLHTDAPRYLHTPERFDSRSRPGRAVPSYRELRPEGGLAVHSWFALLAEITLKIIVPTTLGFGCRNGRPPRQLLRFLLHAKRPTARTMRAASPTCAAMIFQFISITPGGIVSFTVVRRSGGLAATTFFAHCWDACWRHSKPVSPA